MPTNVNDLAVALYDGIALIARRLRQAPTPGELSMPERSALSRLYRGAPATAADLARAEQITPQAMATTLATLEQRGLVERRPDPDDRRRLIMSVTKTGADMRRHKRNARTGQVATTLAERFTPEEHEILAAAVPLIERLAESI